ncbi:quinone oxidoreductase family protein [Pseudonocardia sp. GCM10023141]|uniref:quinone oxidoreductase family protein n=1 Tax=Pseudonocardia sp. GCM10023141 TaxID=3252653 RepID=UPI00361EE44F
MRAIQITTTGGPDVLTPADLPTPEPGPGQVLVEVAAAGVNFIDTYQRQGIYPIPLPFVPGMEAAGRVRALGADVTDVAVGDRVAWGDVAGSYAELAAVPAARVVPVPDGITDEQAAGAMLQGMTTHYLLHDSYHVRPGDDILVHAGAGGTGLLLTQLATALGARVITTVSSAEKEALSRAAGASDVVRYTEVDDLAAEVRALTGGTGVAAVYDGVGATTFDASLASLRIRGTLVLFGAASGPVPPVDPQRLNSGGSLFLTRPTLAHHVITTEELRTRAAAVLAAVADGTLDIRIGARYPLADAKSAHEDLQGRRTTGKVLLTP